MSACKQCNNKAGFGATFCSPECLGGAIAEARIVAWLDKRIAHFYVKNGIAANVALEIRISIERGEHR